MKDIVTSWETVKVEDQTQMRLFTARAENPTGGLIVLPEIFGINPFMQNVTARFAALGYTSVAPELFHRTAEPGFQPAYSDMESAKNHMNALTHANMENDIKAAYQWLERDQKIKNIATVGFCLGGACAFIANGVVKLKAAVSFYGSRIPTLLNEYAGKQQAPLLMIWGGLDKGCDPEKRLIIDQIMTEKKKTYRQIVFSDADHAFFNDDREKYNPDAAKEAWALVAQFLADHLKN